MAEPWAPIMLNVAALAAVAVAVALLALNAGHRPTRTFAYLLLLGGGATLINYGFNLLGPGLDRQGALAAPYFYIPGPLLVLYFASVYPRPRTWLGKSRWGGWAVLGAILALGGLYAWDHGLWTNGPLRYTRLLEPLVAVGVGLLFTRDYLRGESGVVPGALLLFIAGFTLSAGYSAARDVFQMATGYAAVTEGRVWWALALGPYAAIVALLARRLRVTTEPAARRALRRTIGLMVAGAAFAVLTSGLLVVAPALAGAISGVPAAIVSLAGTGVIAYALLRHRLFDIDLRARRTIRTGTVVGSFGVVLFVGSEAARAVLPVEASLFVGALGAVALVAALRPLQRAADHVARGVLPEAADATTFLTQRKLEVYRAALEQAYVEDGELPPREAARLSALRAELGLSERDHAVLAFAVRDGRTPWRPRPVEPGDLVLGRYRVARRLGEGANGVTFAATEESTGRTVALKVLRAEQGGDPEVLREARALQALRHPRVVALHEVAEHAGQAVLVMEFLEGGSLAARLAGGALAGPDAARVARGLLAGLGAVHAAGMVHRDVKPSNVLLTAEGEAKLADFGIAHLPGFETTVGGGDLATAIGTVRFMSPEQARGRRVTQRSDLFSAAATLYEAWTGQAYLPPLPGESAVELQMRAAAGRPFAAAVAGPPGLRAWFARALDPDPAKRFPSAAAMLAALDRALAGAPAAPRGSAGKARP